MAQMLRNWPPHADAESTRLPTHLFKSKRSTYAFLLSVKMAFVQVNNSLPRLTSLCNNKDLRWLLRGAKVEDVIGGRADKPTSGNQSNPDQALSCPWDDNPEEASDHYKNRLVSCVAVCESELCLYHHCVSLLFAHLLR